MPTLLSGVVRDGLVSLFATLWLLSGHFSATALKQDGGPTHLAEIIQGPRIYAQEKLPPEPLWTDVERLFAELDVTRPHRCA